MLAERHALLGFSDALDKTTFAGGDVGGLSALTLGGAAGRGGNARALVDNQGSTPARTYDLKLDEGRRGEPRVRVTGTTRLTRPDGSAYTRQEFRRRGARRAARRQPARLLRGPEPSGPPLRRDGRQLGEGLPVPERVPRRAGRRGASTNLTFEGTSACRRTAARSTPAWRARSLGDGRTPGRRRGPPTGSSAGSATAAATGSSAGQLGYRPTPAWRISELLVVGGDDQLLVLERGFVASVGSTGPHLPGVPGRRRRRRRRRRQLAADGVKLVAKRLLVDLGDCPPSGATGRVGSAQANPLLDNVEAMALGDRLRGGRRELYLLSDDNFSSRPGDPSLPPRGDAAGRAAAGGARQLRS